MKGVKVKMDIDKSIKAKLDKNHACYVLLTCDAPGEDGQMQVNMSYKGDPVLASFLLEGAQTIIDEETDHDLSEDRIAYLEN